jgi:hypothetical protein
MVELIIWVSAGRWLLKVTGRQGRPLNPAGE